METRKILNCIAFALAVIGIIFKANYFPGANISIVLSGLIMLVTLIMFTIKDNKQAGLSNRMNYFLVGTMAFFIVGLIFKFQHWPSAGMFVIVGYILGFILPIVLIMQKNDFKVPGQFLVTFFTYFILLIARFPNNPISKYLGNGLEYTITTNSPGVSFSTSMDSPNVMVIK